MRVDWVPFSASGLVAGATALSIGALLMPQAEEAQDMLHLVQDEGGRWLAVSLLYFAASVALVIGLPAILTLFDRRGLRTGLTAVGVFTIGCVGIAGFAMLLVFFRALAVTDAIDIDTIDEVSSEPGLAAVLYGWIAAFYLGELLLSIALFKARTTPLWIPVVLLLHVALFPVSSLLPDDAQSLTTLLITVGLCGVGITANQHATRVPTDLSY
jgi:hypothetical protein